METVANYQVYTSGHVELRDQDIVGTYKKLYC